jgi:hypothetical protein
LQDLRSYCDHYHKFIVIATARNAAGSNPEVHKTLIAMDCFVGCAASQLTPCLAHFVMEITQVRKSCLDLSPSALLR